MSDDARRVGAKRPASRPARRGREADRPRERRTPAVGGNREDRRHPHGTAVRTRVQDETSHDGNAGVLVGERLPGDDAPLEARAGGDGVLDEPGVECSSGERQGAGGSP